MTTCTHPGPTDFGSGDVPWHDDGTATVTADCAGPCGERRVWELEREL